MDKVCLVIGGSGFLGSYIVDYLLEKGKEVVVLDNAITKKEKKKYLQGDITNYNDVLRAMEGVDTVFHVASIINLSPLCSKELWAVNVEGTKNIVNACIESCVTRLIYTSTLEVTMNGKDMNGEETLNYPKNPMNAYIKTKVAAEEIVLKSNGKICKNGELLSTCALRPVHIYGPGDILIMNMLSFRKWGFFPRFNTKKQDVVYVHNVAHAHYQVACHLQPKSKVAGNYYTISEDFNISYQDFGMMMIKQVKNNVGEVYFPMWIIWVVSWLVSLVIFILNVLGWYPKCQTSLTLFHAHVLHDEVQLPYTKAMRDFGYKPIVSKEDALQLTFEWVRKNFR